MRKSRSTQQSNPGAREKLLDAALCLIRLQGYSATTVNELCKAAGVTKGAFFHHFVSKEDLGVAAAEHWSQLTGGLFATAPYHAHEDPLARVLAYIDFRAALIDGPVESFTCLVGTMVQESFQSSAAIREACRASIAGHAATLEADLDAAIRQHGVMGVTGQSLALHTQAVLQGAFILAKATGGPEAARDSAAHLKRYFELVFTTDSGKTPR